MEYDRALYRVYERVMEDLSSSPPLIPPRRRVRHHHQDQSQSLASSSNVVSSSIQGITVANSDEHQQQQQVATETSAASRSPSNDAADNTPQTSIDNIGITPSHHQHHTAEKAPIPFFLPLCLAPYGDALLDAAHTRDWNRLWHTICYHASIHYHECTTALLSFSAACFHRYCSRTSRRRVNGGSYMDVNNYNYDDGSPPPSQHGSSIELSNRSTTVVPPPQSAFLNGLRLRHRTATTTGDSSHSNSSSGTNNTDNYSTTLNNDDDEDDDLPVTGGNLDDNNVTQSDVSPSSPIGTRRLARQVALLQHHRSSNDTNDNNNSREDDDRGGCTQKGVYALGRISLFFALWHLFVLYCLHCTYVGGENIIKEYDDNEVEHSRQVGMNGDKFKRRRVLEGSDGDFQNGSKKRTCIEYALATRPAHLRSQYFQMYGDDDDKEEDEDKKTSKEGNANENEDGVGSDKDQQIKNISGDAKGDEQQEIELPLLGKDEILQIKILYGGKCTGQCSRVHTVVAPSHNGTTINDGTDNDDDDPNLRFRRNLVDTFSPQQMGYWTQYDSVWDRIRSLPSFLSVSALPLDNKSKNNRYGMEHVHRSLADMLKLDNITSNNGDGNEDANASSDPFSTAKYWEEPHYIFSTNEALLYLDKNIRSFHNITLVNITVTQQCLATGTDQVTHLKNSPSTRTRFAQFMSQIYGMDTIIINQLMYGIKTVKGKYRNGHVQNLDTKERWTWTHALLEQHNTTHGNSDTRYSIDGTILLIAHKISLLILSILSFFLITSVTALIVRVLTSSGVVMMFPLFAMFRSFGMVGADDRILGFSYPWIGRARRAIAREGVHPQEHLIAGHLAKMFLYYVMYEACQAVWSSVLYFKSIPSSLPLWIYGFAMILEYFSMVFVRSALSAYFFPRITLLYFVWYHLYFYSVPYGFFDVALIPWFLLMVHAMTFTVIALEVPAASRGAVSLECPREVYNRLSWHEWNASLPHEWTIFLPLNSRYIPLHDRDIVGNDVGSGTDNDTVEEDEPSGHGSEDSGTTESVGSNDDDGTRSININGEDDRSLPLGSNDILTSGRDGLHERRIPRMP